MFTFQTAELPLLRDFIDPLLQISNFADIKCSNVSVSLIISHQHHQSFRFTAALQMYDPFFDCLSSSGHYHSRIPLKDFSIALKNLVNEDLFLTFFLPKVHTIASLIFTTEAGDFRSFTPLRLLPPQYEDVDHFDDEEVYVSITAKKFREIVKQFAVYNAKIQVIASAAQIKFYVDTSEIYEEIVLTPERMQCTAGGSEFGDGIEFSFSLNPVGFFLYASRLTEMVWFFRSLDLCTIIKFFSGEWNPIVVYYPDDNVVQVSNDVVMSDAPISD